jgi:hypothetical protein
MLSASAIAYPGMGADMGTFHKRAAIEKRQGSTTGPPGVDAATGPTGQAIQACLNNSDSCERSNEPKVGQSIPTPDSMLTLT